MLGRDMVAEFRCPAVVDAIRRAEARLRPQGGGAIDAVDWASCWGEPFTGRQGHWTGLLRTRARDDLLRTLAEGDRVDLRSAGGPGAGGWLEIPVVREGETPAKVPDGHFLVALADRLRCDLCDPGAQCRLRKQDGSICGAPLDRRGRHALKCPCGPYRTGKHDTMRDFCAAFHRKITGHTAIAEQLVTAWNRVNSRTSVLEEAKLDVATRDAITGNVVYLDVSIACAHSDDLSRQRARSGQDGLAAQNREDEKRRRYPPHGGDLVPVVFETGGRPGDAAMAYVRSLVHGLEGSTRTEVLRSAWQQLSCLLQMGNPEAVLAAIGT